MLSVPQLNLGSVDAINYKTRDQKEFFSKILYREEYLEQILLRNKYFLIGEKGTGKTSYAVFLNNSDYSETLSRIVTLTQTDYRRFVSLIEQKKITNFSYVDVWKVILLLLAADGISTIFNNIEGKFPKFAALRSAIDEYYHNAFRPEVDKSLDLIENAGEAARVLASHPEEVTADPPAEAGGFASPKVNLGYLEHRFRNALSSLKLSKDFVLFIDGIDIRPDQISYEPYIECIRGLANAAWELNTEFFSNIRDTKYHIKVVLLMRPDILDNMGFQNLNAKVRDNGVVLDWMTTYDGFRNSALFKLVAGTISKQQEVGTQTLWDVWKYYFPYEMENLRLAEVVDDPFVGFLRYSFYRPRDVVQYLQLMQAHVIKHQDNKDFFSRDSFDKCQREFSDYLLGEVKDYLSFYHSTVDFDEVIGFFSQLGGNNRFSWDQFKGAFSRYRTSLSDKSVTIRELKASPEEFLQFLYSLNIIGYLEPDEFGGNFVHYCFRDRTTVKLRPKVRYGLQYQVHPGLQRALLVGGKTRRRHRPKHKKRIAVSIEQAAKPSSLTKGDKE
ncbi:hypothetical protein OIU35_33125 [Boseaceae bacterium BT-24-1]|nr:hypothetical protein [Boseaceae bacterium BT-24-1]